MFYTVSPSQNQRPRPTPPRALSFLPVHTLCCGIQQPLSHMTKKPRTEVAKDLANKVEQGLLSEASLSPTTPLRTQQLCGTSLSPTAERMGMLRTSKTQSQNPKWHHRSPCPSAWDSWPPLRRPQRPLTSRYDSKITLVSVTSTPAYMATPCLFSH